MTSVDNTAPDSTVRMVSMALTRVARSPAVYWRKNGEGSDSSRSHIAGCTAALILVSMRTRPNRRDTSNIALVNPTLVRMIPSCTSWLRAASGITVSTSMPVI